MGYNIKFQIEGLVLLLIVAYFYFTKKKNGNGTGNKAFEYVIIVAVFNLMLDIGATITIFHRDEIPIINEIVNMIYLSSLNILTYFIFNYACHLSDKPQQRIANGIIQYAPLMVTELIIFVFPIQYTEDAISPCSYGIPPYAVYASSFIYLGSAVALTIMNRDKIGKVNRLAIYFYIGSELVAAMVQLFNKSYLVVGAACALSVTFLYLAIENPDLDMVHRLSVEKKQISAEMDVATKIQSNILPNLITALPEKKEFEIDADVKMSRKFGGDFYDFFMIDDDHLGMVIADVKGTGIPATLLMVIAKMMIKNELSSGLSPAMAFNKVNRILLRDETDNLQVSCFAAVLNLPVRTLKFANAGHSQPLIAWPEGEARFLDTNIDPQLAFMEDTQYHDIIMNLEKDSVMMLHTDGILKRHNRQGDEYGPDRLVNIFEDCIARREGLEFSDIIDTIRKDSDAFANYEELEEDIAILTLHVK